MAVVSGTLNSNDTHSTRTRATDSSNNDNNNTINNNMRTPHQQSQQQPIFQCNLSEFGHDFIGVAIL